MSEEPEDRTFERWALAGACALALVGIAASLVRRDAPALANASHDAARDGSSAAGDADGASGDLVRIRIGGDRPPVPLPDPEWAPDEALEVSPDPGPRPDRENVHQPSPVDRAIAPVAPMRTVVVQNGETLSQIAQRELGTVRRLPEILEINGIDDPDEVRAGVTLELPPR